MPTDRAPGRARWVLAVVVCAVAIGTVAATAWVTVSTVVPGGGQQELRFSGADVVPAGGALALVLGAAAAALLIVGSVGRRVVAAVIALGAAGWAALAVAALRDPGTAAGTLIAERTGVGSAAQAQATVAPVVAVAVAVVVVLVAVGLARAAWPIPTRRHQVAGRGPTRPAAARDAGVGSHPAAGDSQDLWDAISAGDDPTARQDDSVG